MTYPQEKDVINTLVECQVVFDATGSTAGLIERHPDFAAEIASYFALIGGITSTKLPEPDARRQVAGKRELLRAVVAKRDKRRGRGFTPLAGLAGSLLMFCLCIGVSAATNVPGVRSSINSVLDSLGIDSIEVDHENPGGPKPTSSPGSHGGGSSQPNERPGGGTGSGRNEQLSLNGQPLPSLGGPSSSAGNVPARGGNVSPLPNAGSSVASATSVESGNSLGDNPVVNVATAGLNATHGSNQSDRDSVGSNISPSDPGGMPPGRNNDRDKGVGSAGLPPGQGGTPPGQTSTGNNGNGIANSGTPPGRSGTRPGQGNTSGIAKGRNGVGNNDALSGQEGVPSGQNSVAGNNNRAAQPTSIPTQAPLRPPRTSAQTQPASQVHGQTPPGQGGTQPGHMGNNGKRN